MVTTVYPASLCTVTTTNKSEGSPVVCQEVIAIEREILGLGRQFSGKHESMRSHVHTPRTHAEARWNGSTLDFLVLGMDTGGSLKPDGQPV